MPWFFDEKNIVGSVVHKSGENIQIYYQNRGPDDEKYALVQLTTDGPKVIAFLFLGEVIDPMDNTWKFLWEG